MPLIPFTTIPVPLFEHAALNFTVILGINLSQIYNLCKCGENNGVPKGHKVLGITES